ncbi:MAG TPA: hypothetical protein VIL00_17750 [Pseudonocardiaceae bacterium]
MSRTTPALLATVVALALTGCTTRTSSRDEQENRSPNLVGDVDYVEIYRNTDHFPDVARVCVQGLGFVTTSTDDRRAGSHRSGPLLRVPEWDGFCTHKRQQRIRS